MSSNFNLTNKIENIIDKISKFYVSLTLKNGLNDSFKSGILKEIKDLGYFNPKAIATENDLMLSVIDCKRNRREFFFPGMNKENSFNFDKNLSSYKFLEAKEFEKRENEIKEIVENKIKEDKLQYFELYFTKDSLNGTISISYDKELLSKTENSDDVIKVSDYGNLLGNIHHQKLLGSLKTENKILNQYLNSEYGYSSKLVKYILMYANLITEEKEIIDEYKLFDHPHFKDFIIYESDLSNISNSRIIMPKGYENLSDILSFSRFSDDFNSLQLLEQENNILNNILKFLSNNEQVNLNYIKVYKYKKKNESKYHIAFKESDIPEDIRHF